MNGRVAIARILRRDECTDSDLVLIALYTLKKLLAGLPATKKRKRAIWRIERLMEHYARGMK